jgi:hypothetical protein
MVIHRIPHYLLQYVHLVLHLVRRLTAPLYRHFHDSSEDL